MSSFLNALIKKYFFISNKDKILKSSLQNFIFGCIKEIHRNIVTPPGFFCSYDQRIGLLNKTMIC